MKAYKLNQSKVSIEFKNPSIDMIIISISQLHNLVIKHNIQHHFLTQHLITHKPN